MFEAKMKKILQIITWKRTYLETRRNTGRKDWRERERLNSMQMSLVIASWCQLICQGLNVTCLIRLIIYQNRFFHFRVVILNKDILKKEIRYFKFNWSEKKKRRQIELDIHKSNRKLVLVAVLVLTCYLPHFPSCLWVYMLKLHIYCLPMFPW